MDVFVDFFRDFFDSSVWVGAFKAMTPQFLTLWALILLCIVFSYHIRNRGEMSKRRMMIIAMTLLLLVPGHLVLFTRYERNLPYTEEQMSATSLQTPLPVQTVMVGSSNKVAELTRTKGDTENSVKINYSLRRGAVVDLQFPINLGEIAVAVNEPFWALDRLWQLNRSTFYQAYPASYSHVNPTPREPFCDARRKMAITGQRVFDDSYVTEPPLQIWINLARNGATPDLSEVEIPWIVAQEIDQMAFTVTGEIGSNGYRHMVRWAREFLDSEGEAWLVVQDGYQDQNLMSGWSEELLSADGVVFDRALRESDELDKIAYGTRSLLFQSGADKTPYKGGGFGENLAILFTGRYFESHFGGNAVLVAKVLASMGANPGWRFQESPVGASETRLVQIKEGYRRYVAVLLYNWMSLGGTTHPYKHTQAIQVGFGQVDPSWQMIQEMQNWVSLVYPLTGPPRAYSNEELQQKILDRATMPKVISDPVFNSLLRGRNQSP